MRRVGVSLNKALLSFFMVLGLLVLLELFLSLESFFARLAFVQDFAELSLTLALLLQYCLFFFKYLLRYWVQVCNPSLGVVHVILTREMHFVVHNIIELNSARAANDLLVILHGTFLFARRGIYLHHI